ncbi:hypothetical protein MSG28_006039 [Choristoneura fumiferana]|uniref:Uncharacterized protein n=1 Tax=Choristoneura fumiferana TaxID=7141 RepID=A0ACC0JDD2_CHOFU|nr:hypothetical protein MSG28_006039 [Choristoneura fumiferana]
MGSGDAITYQLGNASVMFAMGDGVITSRWTPESSVQIIQGRHARAAHCGCAARGAASMCDVRRAAGAGRMRGRPRGARRAARQYRRESRARRVSVAANIVRVT